MNDNQQMRMVNGVVVPSAHSQETFQCDEPGCPHLHVVGFGPDGCPQYEIVLSEKTCAFISNWYLERQK